MLQGRQEWSDWYRSRLNLKVKENFFGLEKELLIIDSGTATWVGQILFCLCVWIICFISSEVLIQKQKYKNITWYFHSYWKHRESQRLPCQPRICTRLYEVFIQYVYFIEHLSSIRIHQICYRNWFTFRFLNLGSCHTLIWTKTHECTFIVTCGLNSLLGLAKATEEIARPGYVSNFSL